MDEAAKVDEDIMSSMLTAINDFVKDSSKLQVIWVPLITVKTKLSWKEEAYHASFCCLWRS